MSMLKLFKYELRKARASLLALLAYTAALEVYFLVSMHTGSDQHIASSSLFLALSAFPVSLFLIIRGILAFSSDLRSKTGYLTYMTPHSAYCIIAAKMLFSLWLALTFGLIYGALWAQAGTMLTRHYSNFVSILDLAIHFLEDSGINILDFFVQSASLLFCILLGALSSLFLVYLAVAFSHTILHNRRGRILAAIACYGALLFIRFRFLPSPPIFEMEAEELHVFTRGICVQLAESLSVTAVSLFASGWMLEKKINL